MLNTLSVVEHPKVRVLSFSAEQRGDNATVDKPEMLILSDMLHRSSRRPAHGDVLVVGVWAIKILEEVMNFPRPFAVDRDVEKHFTFVFTG